MLQLKRRQIRFRHLLFIGVIIRLILAPFLAHPFDMFAWYSYVEEILEQGISIDIFGITPIWKLLLIPIAYTYSWLSGLAHTSVIPISNLPLNFDPSYGITVITDPIFNILVKIPLIVADMLSAILIFRIAYFYTNNYIISRRSALLYFFSPIVIWISAAWGQYDSLAVLFTLLSFYLLLVSNKPILSSLSIVIACLIKIYPIIFLVPIILSIIKFSSDKQLKGVRFIFLLIPLGLALLYVQKDVFLGVIQYIIFPLNFQFTSGFGLTYWSISLLTSIDIFWSRIFINVIMLSFFSLSLYYVIKRAKTQFDTVILGSFLFIAVFFLSFPFVFEQRSLMLLAILSLAIAYRPSLRPYFILLSLLAFFYAQKNFPFYLLPIASKFPDSFLFLFSYISLYIDRSSIFIAPTFISGLVLFVIGISFSSILFILTYKIFRINDCFNNK